MGDAGLVVGSLWLALRLHQIAWTDLYVVGACFAVILFVLIAEWKDLYRAWRGAPLHQEMTRLVETWIMTAVCLVVFAFVTKRSGEISRLVIGTWFVTSLLALLAWRGMVRLGLRTLRAHGRNSRTVAIVGTGDLGTRLMRTMLQSSWMGLRVVGFFDDSKRIGYRPVSGDKVSVVGGLEDVVRRARTGELDLIYIALPLGAEERIRELVSDLADTKATVYLVPDIFCFDLLHARMVNFGGVPTVSLFENPFSGVDGWVKRLEDLFLASLILLFIAIPMLLIALGVKLSSRGPVFFKQRRYGLDGKDIMIWKFRTMTVCEDGPDVPQATKDDKRVTRFGAFLRRTSLDELPQFLNVLGGSMSVVGPRPHAVAHNEMYRKLIRGYMLRHRVKPGITGWAQVNGFRGETDKIEKMEKRVEHDLWYIRNWSLWLDLRIVAASVFKGFVSENAY
jgi:putative colanic acid biosysnthesis UDP-glucose lipid carrier transferase